MLRSPSRCLLIFMAPDRASAKLSALLKGWGSITRRASSSIDCSQPLAQVPIHTLCRTGVPFLKATHVHLFSCLGKNSSFPTDMSSACHSIIRLRSINSYNGPQSCKTAGTYLRKIIMMSARCLPPYTVDTDQLGMRVPVTRCRLPFCRLCISRSLTAMPSQNMDIPPENPKPQTAESQPTNAESKAALAKATGNQENAKATVAGSRQADIEEALRNFEALLDRMEACGSADHTLGATCLRLAQLCDSAGVEPAKILSYGQRALRVYKNTRLSWEHVTCLHVIGHAYFNMGNYENTVAHLEQSASILKRLKPNVSEKDVNTLVHARESLLGQAKMSLGRFGEALPHFKKSVKLAEKILEPGNPDLGLAYLEAAQAYKEAKDPDKAICLCIKAVDNHANYYGPKSLQAADIRRFMCLVYFDLREYDNVLLEYEEVRPIFEGLGKFDQVASLDLVAVESLLKLEKFDEAISKLNGFVSTTPETNPVHGSALVLLAKATAIMKDFEGAAKYCKMALQVLEKQQLSIDTGSNLVNLALVFQRQQEIELATSTYRKALEVYKQFSGYEASAAVADIEGQIGFLLLHMEKIEEAVPFLESSVSKKQATHSSNSVELLDVHNHLGVAYSEEGKLDEALKQFEAAESILSKNVTEVDSLTISIYGNLSNMYTVFGRFDEAIACQKLVVDSIKRNPDVDSMVSLEEATKILEDIKREAGKKESVKGREK
ncbi:hypothetical protein GOP47_0006114 [Adiantum capillus-veneris]|uniref:Uncharacterized protein n=1 Tax=Adiantum capillus-veneris TaxID=13818 RepID=A0A9D4ZK07_ADICA|nr:hypothetical protein GOP47_0006114 [Adiantum capillus-veneris]